MREINLNGYIDEEVWYGDEITPALLHDALYGPDNLFADDVHIRMNSYGGSCNAAVRMFDDIRAYPGSVTITISGTAASAATVLSMAADHLEMTPGSLFMIHNPSTIAWGNENDFLEAIQLLRACKESILNCYGVRCSLARDMVAAMMTATTWMDATAALQHGFIDAVAEVVPGVTNAEGIHTVNRKDAEAKVKAWLERHKPKLSRPSTGNDHTSSVPAASEQPLTPNVEDGTENTKPDAEAIKPSAPAFSMPSCPEGTPVDQLLKRLELIKPIR